MKKMKKVMLIMLIAVLALFVLQSIVSATPLNITSALNNTTESNATGSNSTGATDLPILTSNNQQSTNTANNTTNNTTNNTSTNNVINNTETLPQTGLTEDITIMFFIVLCVASAVFAYVKISKYNER